MSRRLVTTLFASALVFCLSWSLFGSTSEAAKPRSSSQAPTAKNVILMVADGAGFNTWRAGAMYRGRLGKEVYDGEGWVRLGCTTYPLNLSKSATGKGTQDERIVYDPAKAWDSEDGYKWLKSTATDSAASGTALATGRKTYNSAINWSDTDEPMSGETLPEIAHKLGKRAGVVTSVEFSHATPATLGGAHNRSRNAYQEIAAEMLAADYLNVIMGAGHPEFDDNGKPKEKTSDADYKYVGGKTTWNQLVTGNHPGGWTLIQTKAEFEKLTTGKAPSKIVGTAQVATTLQQKRGGLVGGLAQSEPFAVPKNANVPSLATMTKAALNCLDDDPDGFYLMVEGGAVDWANHANQEHRMIEEYDDFMKAVEAVVEWVEENSSWDETLLILTADHDCGLPWGPDSAEVPFQPIVDNGPGKMPGLHYNAGGHSNMLVPVFAKGAGSVLLLQCVRGRDPHAAKVWDFSGDYIDNTDINHTIVTAMGANSP
ncbi:alkaline phosphatase [Thermostilla marina]